MLLGWCPRQSEGCLCADGGAESQLPHSHPLEQGRERWGPKWLWDYCSFEGNDHFRLCCPRFSCLLGITWRQGILITGIEESWRHHRGEWEENSLLRTLNPGCECSWEAGDIWLLFCIGGCLEGAIILFKKVTPVKNV